MNNLERKKAVLDMLSVSDKPLSGSDLAKEFNVTRQIIVADIALLRAEGQNIISTAKGYTVEKSKAEKAVVNVSHDASRIADELETVVDLGGRVLNTHVYHPAYGNLGEALNVCSRKDIKAFIDKINSTGCEPLLKLTGGAHTHTIEADSRETINEIIKALDEKGYLIK